MRSFLAALQFLTIFPLPEQAECDEKEIGRSVTWFPMVGLLAGLCAAGIDCAANRMFGLPVASVLTTLALLAVSGGLHADGLADTGDGFFSSRPRDRVLEIMRDSHIGTMGVLALFAVLALKCAALMTVPSGWRWQTLALMGLTGRCGIVVQLNLLPYARINGGLSSLFYQHRKRWDLALALILLGAGGWLLLGGAGMVIAAASVIALLLFSLWCVRKIGGFTGDTLGATCEILEMTPALVVAAVFHKLPI